MIEEIRAFHSGMLFRYQIKVGNPSRTEAEKLDDWIKDQVGRGVKRWTAYYEPLEKTFYMRFRYHQDAVGYLMRWGYPE